MSTRLGLVGGMGPLASAAFVRSIYGMYQGRVEQELPFVALYSDPSIGDRTATFLGGGDCGPLVEKLETALRSLLAQGVDRIIICCVTAHYLLPRVRPELRGRVASLLDAVVDELERARKRCLIASSTGSSRLRILQQHERWSHVDGWAVIPSSEEQAELHEAIYRLKREHTTAPLTEVLGRLAHRHGVSAILAGCTELHLLAPAYAGQTPLNRTYEFLDPLTAVARRCMEEEYATAVCL